jgi:hypothetical protein
MKLLPFVADYVIMNAATTLLQLVSLGFVIKGMDTTGQSQLIIIPLFPQTKFPFLSLTFDSS